MTGRKRRSILRSFQTLYHRTARFLSHKIDRIKYAIHDFKYKLKAEFPILHDIENKIEEKMDDIACLQSRIEYYGNERKKKINEHLAIQNGDYSNHYGDYNNHYGYSNDQSG